MKAQKALAFYSVIFNDVYLNYYNLSMYKELELLSQIPIDDLSEHEKNRQGVLSLMLQKEDELNKARNNYRAALYYFNKNEIDEFELMSYEWAVFEILDEIDEINRYNG